MTLASAALDTVAVGRWQFGITTVYHFFLVPLTIGLALAVAIMQTIWHHGGHERWLKATRFFGRLLIITFALGVATGIVQEFQFGMNWSEYSRYVGDIFGAPLAVEALLAFFLESTFLGLWIFGWGRLSKGAHLAMIWLVAIGVHLSALWILAANSWMQHPVGATFNPETGRAELDGAGGFFRLLANPMLWLGFSHVVMASWLLAGTFVAGVALWWLTRAAREGGKAGAGEARDVWRPVALFGLVFTLIGGIGVAGTGDLQGQELSRLQPMKMASGEAVCVDTQGAQFTVAAFGSCPLGSDGEPTRVITIPKLASILETHNPNGTVEGVRDIQSRMVNALNADPDFVARYGDAAQYDYRPPQMPVFWSFRLMIGLGAFSAVLAIWGLLALRGGRLSTSRALGVFALVSIPMPFLASSFGWIFTEMGRQPWVVYPNGASPADNVLMLTQAGISTSVSAGQMLATLIAFTLLYLALGIVWFLLLRRYVREGVDAAEEDKKQESAGALAFGY